MAAAATVRRGPRTDPTRRPLDGVLPHLQVNNKDPNRFYVWVYMNGDGPSRYDAMGYKEETFSADGVTLFGNKTGKPGSPVIRDGHVLMSVSKERKREIELYGEYGSEDQPNGGQIDANALEERIVKQRGGLDPLRGMTGLRGRASGEPIMAVQNETSELLPE